jgi:hypothetical protein
MFGYFATVADAEKYFEDERLETEAWDDLIPIGSDPDELKKKCLMQSFNRITHSPLFSLPLPSIATAAELIILKMAQAEMAYYIALHVYGGDEDARKGIQTQGVVKADVVGETYDRDRALETPIPPAVIDILSTFTTTKGVVFPFNLGRDENRSAMDRIQEFD